MVVARKAPSTEGTPNFHPDELLDQWSKGDFAAPVDDNFQAAIIKTFGLKPGDQYVYHATASVTLGQVQQAINYGSRGGLHAWYRDEQDKEVEACP